MSTGTKTKKPVYLLVMEVGNKTIYLKDSSAVLPYLAMSNPVKEDRLCDLLLCLKACIFSDSIVYTRLFNVGYEIKNSLLLFNSVNGWKSYPSTQLGNQ